MQYYDRIAKGYDELHGEEQNKKLTIIIGIVQQQTISGKVLDVGAGTGRNLDALAKATNNECIGIEPSKGMIEQYKGSCELLQGRAEALPFSDESFALVVSMTAVQNFDDITLGVCEMLRVLKKEGLLIISCLKKSEKLLFVSESLAENCIVLEAIEEDKDIIFVCRRRFK